MGLEEPFVCRVHVACAARAVGVACADDIHAVGVALLGTLGVGGEGITVEPLLVEGGTLAVPRRHQALRGSYIKPQRRLLHVALLAVEALHVSPCAIVNLVGSHGLRLFAHLVLRKELGKALCGTFVASIVRHLQIEACATVVLGPSAPVVQVAGEVQHGCGAAQVGTFEINLVSLVALALLVIAPSQVAASRAVATVGGSTQAAFGELQVLSEAVAARHPVVAAVCHVGCGHAFPLFFSYRSEPVGHELLGVVKVFVGTYFQLGVTIVQHWRIGFRFIMIDMCKCATGTEVHQLGALLYPSSALGFVFGASIACVVEESKVVHGLRVAFHGGMACQLETAHLVFGGAPFIIIADGKVEERVDIGIFAPRLLVELHGSSIALGRILLRGYVI